MSLLEHHLSKNFSEFKVLSAEKLAVLNQDLPQEAFKQHPSKSFLTTINAAFIYPVLNDVFGVGGWIMDSSAQKTGVRESEKSGESILAKVEFLVPEYGIYRMAYGGNNNPDTGDAYKGAVTDAFTKICSTFMDGVGKVWRNEIGKPKVEAVVAKKWLTTTSPEWATLTQKYKSIEDVKKDFSVANSVSIELAKLFTKI
jgi:hypothetical protein